MVLGMSLHTFTMIHVVFCVLELAVGAFVALELMNGRVGKLAGFFLLFALLTDITSFLFPFHGSTPGFKLAIMSSATTMIAILALYVTRLRGRWYKIFAVSALITLYFDAFVAVVQSFEKVGRFHAIAPNGNERPVVIVQAILLMVFLIMAIYVVRRAPVTAKAATAPAAETEVTEAPAS